jgi:hypothetical protein
VLAKVADLIENHPYCVWHRPPDNTELEARVRQLAREEIDAAGYAEEITATRNTPRSTTITEPWRPGLLFGQFPV